MTRLLVTLAAALFLANPANAQKIVRDKAALEQVAIQGVTLSMTAEEAFNALRRTGFKAGDLDEYADWTTDGIEFVRGNYGSPEGFSSVGMERRGERIVWIGETYNAPGSPLDADAEIGAVRRQLGIAADAKRCKTNDANGGTCEVQDAEDNESVNVVYTLQVLSTMRMVSITRSKELQ